MFTEGDVIGQLEDSSDSSVCVTAKGVVRSLHLSRNENVKTPNFMRWTEHYDVVKAQAGEGVHRCNGTYPAGSFCKPVVQSYCLSTKLEPVLKNWELCLTWVLWKTRFACKRARGPCTSWGEAPAWHQPQCTLWCTLKVRVLACSGVIRRHQRPLLSSLDSHLHRSSKK